MNDKKYLEDVKGFKFYENIESINIIDILNANMIKFVNLKDDDYLLRVQGCDHCTIVIESTNQIVKNEKIEILHKVLKKIGVNHNYSKSNSQINIVNETQKKHEES